MVAVEHQRRNAFDVRVLSWSRQGARDEREAVFRSRLVLGEELGELRFSAVDAVPRAVVTAFEERELRTASRFERRQ